MMRSSIRTHRNLGFAVLLCCSAWLAFGVNQLNWRVTAAAQDTKDAAAKLAAPADLWQATGTGQFTSETAATRTYHLNQTELESLLGGAPHEFTASLKSSLAVLSLPLPDGSLAHFQIEESPILEPSLAAQLPAVKTYRGQGVDDPTATVRFDWTPTGLHALILSAKGSFLIEPKTAGDTLNYRTQTLQTLDGPALVHCGVTEADVAEALARGVYRTPSAPAFSNGSTLRIYRLAVAASGEYTSLYGGGSVANTQAAITSAINLVDAIYEKELAVRFTLVNNTNIIFTNAATDPYSSGASGNSADSATLTANQTTLDGAGLGSANYDIGHVFGGITGLSPGSASFSGLAQLGVVCVAGSKARGVSTMGGLTATLGIFITGIAHEIGHQFSAPHSFNGTLGSCGGSNRSSGSAYESGSGSTIMSYASTCGNDNIVNSTDVRFHAKSFETILNFMTMTATCNTSAATGNTPPTVNAGADFTIPKNTPFTLTATASDPDAADAGNLTYTWEQIDAGGASFAQNGTEASYNDAADPVGTTTRPIFRPFAPTNSLSRIFPSLTYILNNANDPPQLNGVLEIAEELPRIGRTLNFRFTARDNRANGGGVTDDSVVLTVDNNSGPFLVTAPNTAVSWTGNTAQTVTWSVNGTSALAANVKISLSTDGGNNFSTVITASTPNDGSETITVPNVTTAQARLKIEAVGNIFFDISDANFNITAGAGGTCPTVTNLAPTSGTVGTQVIITGTNFTGVTGVRFSNNVTATFTVNSATQITTTVPTGAVTGPITLSKAGCADVTTGTFTVTAPTNCPTITNINPTSGAIGSQVVLTGSNFTGDTQVTFSNNVIATYTTNSSTQITATVPVGAVTGLITIRRLGDPCTPSNSGTFRVCNISFTPTNLGATSGVPFSQALTATGGTAPYTFSGFQPFMGLTMSASGVISGTPTACLAVGCLANYPITVTDATGCSVTQNVNFSVSCSNIAITPSSNLTATFGVPFTQTFTPSGGVAPYSFDTFTASGLTMSATGVLSGTPNCAGGCTSILAIRATDAAGCSKLIQPILMVLAGGNACSTYLPIKYGQTLTGELTTGDCTTVFGDGSFSDLYTFNGTAGDQIAIRLNSTAFNAYLRLTYPDGFLDDDNGGGGTNARIPTNGGFFTLPATGAYRIIANTYPTQSGAYSLNLRRGAVKSDFDDDGKTDLSVFRPSAVTPTPNWLALSSVSGQAVNFSWGGGYAPYFDVPVPGDYDGDGKADYAIWRGADTFWYIRRSSDGQPVLVFYGANFAPYFDIPVPGDFDGDGKTDIAVFRRSGTWFIRRSSDGGDTIINHGQAGDIPLAADFDGDGKCDLGLFRPDAVAPAPNWIIRQSSTNTVVSLQWGGGYAPYFDVPVPADYDGDGKADLAIWRGADSIWYIRPSATPNSPILDLWGANYAPYNDIPTPGDYDGDGKADIAVFRRTGTWFIKRSSDGSNLIQNQGQQGDTPLPANGVR